MAFKKSPVSEEPFSLVAINLHEASEFDELTRQRKICGWNYRPEYLNGWRDSMDAREKTLFWITLTAKDGARAGHVSLDSLAQTQDVEVQNFDKSIMTIKTFFIMPEYRTLGLGRRSMDVLEEWAQKEPYGSPNCKAIVVDTITKRYYQDAKYMAEIQRLFPVEKEEDRFKAQLWYERRGYVQWKEEPRYNEVGANGETCLLTAAFLRKDLS